MRQCVSRLKVKAERLLKNITDFKERADPVIPGEVPVRGVTPRVNGVTMNGSGRRHGSVFRSPSPTKQSAPLPGQSRKIQRDTTFAESTALVRTQAGMTSFIELERDVDHYLARHPQRDDSDPSVTQLKERLLRFVCPPEDDGEADVSLSTLDGGVGVKRKLYVLFHYRSAPVLTANRNGFLDDRPRKRARMQGSADKDVLELWWDAMRSDELVANGVPSLVRTCSGVSAPSPPKHITDPPRQSNRRRKKKQASSPNTLLYHMNNNIRTLRRVRTTHAKFSALNQSMEENGGIAQPPVPDAAEDLDDVLDEQPWKPVGSGIEMGQENANECLRWMGGKVLEHAGFQGESKLMRLL